MESKTRTFKRAKETRNKVVFEEQPSPGEAPIIESLYVAKWFAGDVDTLTVSVVKQ